MNTDQTEAQQERIQTRIEMIRTESRILSYKIERMEQQRHQLQEEKRKLKEVLDSEVSK
jgi:predicted  nucleic acid-binding Zn-ribbon protein